MSVAINLACMSHVCPIGMNMLHRLGMSPYFGIIRGKTVHTSFCVVVDMRRTRASFQFSLFYSVGAVVQLVEYRTRYQEVAGSTHTRSTASNLEQVANLLCAQANSASYPQRDGK